MGKKVTLEQMAAAAQERADWHASSAERSADDAAKAAEQGNIEAHRHHLEWQRQEERDAAVFDAMAKLLRILGTFEDRSRKFVAGLIEEHGR